MRKIDQQKFCIAIEQKLMVLIATKISELNILFPTKISADQLKIYVDVLSEHFDEKHFLEAFRNVQKTFIPNYGCQFPTIAHFISACQPSFPGVSVKAEMPKEILNLLRQKNLNLLGGENGGSEFN